MNTHKARAFRPWRYEPQLARFDQLPITKVALEPPMSPIHKKEALLDDPAMAAYQIEELLTRVLSEKERVLPSMKAEIDWDSFESSIRYYINLIYRMQHW